MAINQEKRQAWLDAMQKRYPWASDVFCVHCKEPYASYTDVPPGFFQQVAVHKTCPDFTEPDKRSNPAYQLTLTEGQAQVLSDALDIYSRLHMGQLDSLQEILACYSKTRPGMAPFHEIRQTLQDIEPMITGLSNHAYYGIHSPELKDTARVAWDLHRVLRHRLAWDRNPEGGFTVQYDKPDQSSQEPLATITKLN